MTAGSSSSANITVRSKPCEPVMSTPKPLLNRSAEIQALCGPFGVFATRDDGRFDALATVDGESFDVEDRQRHTAQLYDHTDAWS